MSVEKIASVLHHAPIGGTAKLLLIGIANHEGDGGAWPAIATLARYASVNERNARKMMQKLIESGLVESITRDGRTSVYRTRIECPPECDRSTNHRLTPVATDTPVFRDPPVAGDPPTPVAGDRGTPVASDPRTVIEPSLEPTIKTLSVESLFDTFMERYPRKSDERNAWASFGRLSLSDALKALDGLDRYLASKEFPSDRKYIPYAANWIDRQKWLEEYTPKVTAPSDDFVARVARIKDTSTTQHPAEHRTPAIKCIHGNTGYCRECYTQQVKENNNG
jgi:hypothetical protein